MKVFEFSYEVDYGRGVALIGAKNLEEAEKIANNSLERGFGYWVFAYEHQSLVYKGEEPGVILCEKYAE